MEVSIENFIQEVKAVVFEKDEMQFRDLSEPKATLPLLANQNSNSDL